MRALPAASVTLLAAVLLACSSTPGPQDQGAPHPTGTAAPAGPVLADWSAARWRSYASVANGFTMQLPEDAGWQIEDTQDAWFVAAHPAASTQIAMRMFGTDGLANRARCEAHARESRNLPSREGAVILDKRLVDLPKDFDTIVEVGIAAAEPGKPITGYVLAFGGWVKKCFAYALTTSAKGKGAEEAVGDRLALFVERSLLHLHFANSLQPRVPRERPPLGP